MPRRPLKKLQKQPEIQPWKIQVLKDGLYPDTGFEGLYFFYSDRHHDSKKDLYELIHKDFVRDWIEKHPCTRPWAWWEYDNHEEERQHINGGKRCTYYWTPQFYKGIFEYWHFDENDPPMFESEARYLQRLNLLTDSEKKYLSEHPELLEPINIEDVIPGIQSEK